MPNITKDTFEPGEMNTLIFSLMQFKESMQVKNALGDDDTGEAMRIGYLHQCDKLLLAIVEASKK